MIEEIPGIHEAQILTYLKLAKLKIALLINFNVPTFTSLLTDYGKRSVFAANRPCWPHVGTDAHYYWPLW